MIPSNNIPKIVHIILCPSSCGFLTRFLLLACPVFLFQSCQYPSAVQLLFLWSNLPAYFRKAFHLFLSFLGGPSSSDTCVQNLFWGSAVEHPYQMPSPLQSFNAHIRKQASVFLQSVGTQFFKYHTVHLIRQFNFVDGMTTYGGVEV